MTINATNVRHAALALTMQAVLAPPLELLLVFAGIPWRLALFAALIVGAAAAIGAFVSREHAHRQNDIADTTGVPVMEQDPVDGFYGWSPDARMDAKLPALCVLLVVLAAAVGLVTFGRA